MKIILFLPFFLTGCSSSIIEEDCNRNMRDVGYQDGSRGLSDTMFETYKTHCSWKNEGHQLSLYTQGYLEGSKNHCTYRFGEMIAESGRPFPKQCNRFSDFSQGFAEGKKKAFEKKASEKKL